MPITQISQIQVRRGLDQDLPQLASGELGWSIDKRKLYIGNGLLEEGAPELGVTEILSEYSILDFTNGFSANIVALEANVAIIQGNIVTIQADIAALQAGTSTANVIAVPASSGGSIGMTGNNGIISYTLNQGTAQRTGQIKFAYQNSAVSYDEEYSQSASTDFSWTMTANVSAATLTYLNSSGTDNANVLYSVTRLV